MFLISGILGQESWFGSRGRGSGLCGSTGISSLNRSCSCSLENRTVVACGHWQTGTGTKKVDRGRHCRAQYLIKCHKVF